VSIGSGSRVEGSELRDTIVGTGTTISNSTLTGSMIGDSAVIDGARGQLNISDHSVVRIER